MKRGKILIFLIVLSIPLFTQNIPKQYKEAMDAFNRSEFVLAAKLFDLFGKNYTIDDEFSATAYYYLGTSLLKLEKVDPSISAFEFFVKKYTWSNFRSEALYKLGTLYYEQANYFKCRISLFTLINSYPQSEFIGPSFYFIGESYSAEENYDNAIKYLEESFATKKNNKYLDYSIYSLAYVYEKLSKYLDAVAYYDTLLAYYKSSTLASIAQLRIGICYFKLKEYDNTILELSDPLIEQLPPDQFTEAKFILAHSFYRLREFSNADKTFKKIINENPSSGILNEIKYGLGWTYFQQQKYDEAYIVFDALSKEGKDSISINSFFWSAECKRYEGKDAEADSIYKAFIKNFPNSQLIPKVQLQIGITSINDKKQFTEDNLMAALNSPDKVVTAKALTLLGELKLNQKYFNVAKNSFEEVLSLEEISDEIRNRALLGLGVSLYYLENYTEAIEKFHQLQLKSPQFEKDKVNFYLAESFFAKRDFTSAIKNYSKVDNNNKDLNAQLLYGKAYAYFNSKDYSSALFSFSDFLRKYKQDSKYADARLRLADCYYGLKKYSEAGRVYKEIFLSDDAKQNNDYTLYQYAQALYKSGNSDEAIEEFAALQRKFPESKYITESQYVIGWIYFQRGDFSDAIRNYKILINNYPKSPLVPITYNSIGNSYFNVGKFDSANIFYNKVLDEYPNTSSVFDAINGIKDSYIANGKPDQATAFIDRYIAGNPKAGFNDQLFFKKCEIYYSLGNYEKSKQAFKEFINGYSNSTFIPDAYYWIGKSAANLKQNEEAITNYRKAISFNYNSEVGVSSVLELGKIQSEMKNYDAAINIYETAIDNLPSESPRVAEIAYSKAMAYIAKGDVSKAYEDFNFIIQYHDATIFAANSKFEIALIELARKNYETSDMLLRELSENRNDDLGAKAQFYYGQSLFERDKIDEAITSLVRVRFNFSAYDEWLTRSYLKLGECYEKKNDINKAKELYKIVLTSHQGDEFGKQAQKRLRGLR